MPTIIMESLMEQSSTKNTAAKPSNGELWGHKELELLLSADPKITRVTEQSMSGIVKRPKEGKPTVLFRWRFRQGEKFFDFNAGTWPRKTLKAIRESYEAAKALHNTGKNPQLEKKIKRSQAALEQTIKLKEQVDETVKALAEKWQLADLVKRGSKGRKDGGVEVMRAFEKDVFSAIGSHPIKAVPAKMWLEILDRVKERAPSQAGNLYADLNQFLQWCERRDYIEVSPLRKIKKSDVEPTNKERSRTLFQPDSANPPAELLQLLEKLPNANLEKTTELALRLILGTCCRVGELSMATWNRVNFETREWFLPSEDTKNKSEHRLFISDYTYRHLEDLKKITGHTQWCFPNVQGKNHLDVKTVAKQTRDRQTTKPLKNRSKQTSALLLSGGRWTPHDLRRTAGYIMRYIGVNVISIEACLNHTPAKLVRTYQGQVPRHDKADAWERLGTYLDTLVGQQEANTSKGSMSLLMKPIK
jgi:integrase